MELKPHFFEKWVWPALAVAGVVGICIHLIVLHVVLHELTWGHAILGGGLIISSVFVAGKAYSRSPTWFFKADATGVHQQRTTNGFDTVLESVSWEEIASTDKTALSVLNGNGSELMDLRNGGSLTREEREEFLDFVSKSIEAAKPNGEMR